MRRRLVVSLGVTGTAALLAASGAAQATAATGSPTADLSHSARPAGTATQTHFPARYAALPFKPMAGATPDRTGVTIPMWTGTAKVGTKTYHYSMVGKNPMVAQSNPVTTIATPVIPVVLKFSTGQVFDPTKTNTSCGATAPDSTRTMQSLIFKKITYTDVNANLGNVQFVDAFQRAEFWKYVGASGAINPNYHVNLSGTLLTKVTVNVPAGSSTIYATGCKLGGIDINWWDGYLQSTLMPALQASGVSPTKFPLFVFDNVVMYDTDVNNCCILGYHSAYANPNFGGAAQTYAVADYDTTGDFDPFGNPSDISAMSHEVGEWMDDPLVNDPTPKWGHIGQVSGCQANLEVGDPLSGTYYSIQAPNGFTYHPQEMAFESWFYHQKPSIGVNGYYSLGGTFTTPAAPCS